MAERQEKREKEDPHQEASASTRRERAREKKDLEEKVEETLTSVITRDAEIDQIEENLLMRDALTETVMTEDLLIEMRDALSEIVMIEDLSTETKDALIEIVTIEDLSIEMRDAHSEIAMIEDLLTEMIEDHLEIVTKEDLLIETKDAHSEIVTKEDLSTVTIEDPSVEMKEDSQETETKEDLSTERKDASLEMARMRLQDSTEAIEALRIELLEEMAKEERRTLQSHMAMILSWQPRIGKRLQLTGSRVKKASTTEAMNNRLWWEENPTIFI